MAIQWLQIVSRVTVSSVINGIHELDNAHLKIPKEDINTTNAYRHQHHRKGH
jgi:hypothetical protein